MINFIKKLFGFGTPPKEECPYKVEAPATQDLADIAIAQRPAPEAKPVESKPASKPAKKTPAKKAGAPKKPRGPRKPKAPKA